MTPTPLVKIADSKSEFENMILHITDKAFQVELLDTKVWIPISQVQYEDDGTVCIPDWLYSKLEDTAIESRTPKESPAEKAKKATVFKRLDDIERRLTIIETVLNANSPTGDPMDDPSIPF